jgi:hypothetical protein
MLVEIVSIQAAIHGRPSILWSGDVDAIDLVRISGHGVTTDERIDVERMNSALFRFFNRVDDGDGARLEAIGYRLPSLSVGDLLHWDSKTWRVAGVGFDPITGSDEYVMALAAYTMQSTFRKEATE